MSARTDLIGQSCFVIAKSGRHRWQVNIIDAQPGGYVKISANVGGGNVPRRAFGNDRWVHIRDLYQRDAKPLCPEIGAA